MASELDALFNQLRKGPWVGDPYGQPSAGVSPADNINPAGWHTNYGFSSSPGQANLLYDPTFESISRNWVAITTLGVASGDWKAHYVLNSGTAPSTIQFEGNPRAVALGTADVNSAICSLNVSGFGSNACDLTIYLYPNADYTTAGFTLNWLVGSGRVIKTTTPANMTSVTTDLEIYDGTGAAVAATSDTYDWLSAATISQYLLVAALGKSDPASFRANFWRWRLKINMVKPASSTTSVNFYVAEPSLNFNYTPDALPYGPIIGNWGRAITPEYHPDNRALLAADQVQIPLKSVVVPIDAAADRTLTSTPTFSENQYDGKEVVLLNIGTHTITIQDRGTLAGSKLFLTAATIAIGPNDSVRLVYSVDLGGWVQIGSLVSVL